MIRHPPSTRAKTLVQFQGALSEIEPSGLRAVERKRYIESPVRHRSIAPFSREEMISSTDTTPCSDTRPDCGATPHDVRAQRPTTPGVEP